MLKSFLTLSKPETKSPSTKLMHILQPKHIKLKEKEAEELLKEFNISRAQLPKMFSDDPALPEGSEIGDIIKIERKDGEETPVYYRVIV